MLLDRALFLISKALFGATARWRGCTPSPRQRVYFANHASHLDTVIVWSALPTSLRRQTRPAAARDYWGKGALRRLLVERGLRAVLLDRFRTHATQNLLQPLCEALAAGDSLILFPEGTRNTESEDVKPFKSGLYHLAQQFPSVELIPVYVENARRSLPKGSRLPVPLMCAAHFGAPLSYHAEEDKEAFLHRARSAVEALRP